jgi:cytoplasmic iron level regulating protein YaaA (DUF328/UPF0246 family)
MKIILSPSKSQNTTISISADTSSEPVFKDKAQFLVATLLDHPLVDIMSIYNLSELRIKAVLENYKNFLNLELLPSLHMFSGTSFKGLELERYNKKQQTYLQKPCYFICLIWSSATARPGKELTA